MHRIQYPKLALLLLSFVLASILYRQGFYDRLPTALEGNGYVTLFFGGMLFSFGFTSAFAVALFVQLADSMHPIFGGIIAGIGALIADLAIFQFIRLSFLDELRRLRASAIVRWMHDRLHHETIPERIRQYLLWSLGGIIIASPLPDEIGVTLLSGLTEMKTKHFAIMCFLLNTGGIIAILSLAQTAT